MYTAVPWIFWALRGSADAEDHVQEEPGTSHAALAEGNDSRDDRVEGVLVGPLSCRI